MTLFSRQKGQGLLETLIVILFIAVSATAFLRFQAYLSLSASLAQQQSDATLLAVNQIESLRNFVVISNTPGLTSYQGIASGSSTTTMGSAAYTLTWTVTESTSPAYKTIDMVVAWTDRAGGARSIRMVTQVAGLDPGSSAGFM